MPLNTHRAHTLALNPAHAALIAGAAPLFVGAMLSDIAYARSHQVQWANFGSWLIFGAMILTGLSLLWALIGLLRSSGRGGRPLLVLGLLAVTFVVGFLAALMHARDAWAMMPGGLILSTLAAITALAATWAGFSGARHGDAPLGDAR